MKIKQNSNKIISGMNTTTCSSDPFPTILLLFHIHAIIPILQHIVGRFDHGRLSDFL